MRTTLLVACLCLASVGCIQIKVGTQKIDVYEQYPIYTVEERPILQNLTGEDMDPHKKAAELAAEIIKDGVVTPEEKAQFVKSMESAEVARKDALTKKLSNDNALILWGKKNQATVETYNDYAREKNERLKIAVKNAK